MDAGNHRELGLMAILAFVVVTLLILRSQGISTLTIISIVVGFVISILSLLISFLQWHHPQPTDQPEPPLHSLLQTLTLDHIERSRPSDSPTDPQEQHAASIRSYQLTGLPLVAGQEILKDKGLHGTQANWEALIRHYEGNPLALKLVAQVIREVFDGNITTFLKDGEVFFRNVRDVLDQQMNMNGFRKL